ncbi:hypothetical protein GCM10018965_019080 [Nonomuraea roseola]
MKTPPGRPPRALPGVRFHQVAPVYRGSGSTRRKATAIPDAPARSSPKRFNQGIDKEINIYWGSPCCSDEPPETPVDRGLFLKLSADLYETAFERIQNEAQPNEGLAFYEAVRERKTARWKNTTRGCWSTGT